MSTDADEVQEAVRRVREGVLGGRGPGASEAELARHQRGRAHLGALPSAVERELVAVQTAAARGADPAGPRGGSGRSATRGPGTRPA